MMRAAIVFALFCAALTGASADAAGWPLSRRDPPAPVFLSPAALKADLVAKTGSDTIYFPAAGAALNANAVATLNAQAQWLLANPTVSIRLEGHGGPLDSRDYALAIGEKRASAVRDFLILHGISPDRISVTSWGKERPGTMWVGSSSVFVGPRVVTVVTGSSSPPLLGGR